MISLFTRDEYAAFGVAALCDAERIRWQRVRRLADHARGVLVAVGDDFSDAEVATIASQRALVLNGGPAFAARALGGPARQDDGPATVPLTSAVWANDVCSAAAACGKHALRLPYAPSCRLAEGSRGEPLARFGEARESPSPAVVQVGRCIWCAIDIGSAFAHLLSERYAAPAGSRAPYLRAWARGAAEAMYYAAPSGARRAAQRASYQALERRLAALGACASEYPADATGWLTIELMNALIRRAAGSLARIARWPDGYASAAVLTHDLEPSPYAYGDGLQRLLAGSAAGQQRAFGLVARMSAQHLEGARGTLLNAHEVFCHGLDHRGEDVHGRQRVLRTVERAKAMLERDLRRPIAGYRSPRLDRSADLDWALDQAGFTYDSSRPDVDRENLAHYGRGVRLNLPYRAPIPTAGGWRPSRCLELPLTAPDCIQPLFAGESVDRLRALVTEKAAFVRASGGAYVALVHAGVFGADDAARREAHLAHVTAELRQPGTWLTTPERLAGWWRGREHLRIEAAGGGLRVCNDGSEPLSGAVLLFDRDGVVERVVLPMLAPASETPIMLTGRLAEGGAHAA